MIYPPGATSKSVAIQFVDDSGLALTGKVAADFPTVYWTIAGNTASTSISLSDLAAITTAYSSGGIKERAGSAGYYRLDIPDAALASAGDVRIYGEASGKHVLCPPITVGYIGSNVIQINGTAQTARDVGANVLLSSGTGTGQLDFTGGVVKANLAQILGTAITETAGQLAAAFKQFFDVASPTGTMKAITNVVTATNLTTNNDKTGYALSSLAVQAIWDALTSALTTVGSIGKLLVDNINATISSRSSHSAADVWAAGTRTLTSFGTLVSDIASAVWSAAGRTLTGFGTLVSDIVTAIAAQITTDHGDGSYLRNTEPDNTGIGTAALGAATAATNTTDLPAMIESSGGHERFKATALEQGPTSGGSAPTAGEVADAVWDEAIADHLSAGSTGAKLNAAGAAGDPWATDLEDGGGYDPHQAGAILSKLDVGEPSDPVVVVPAPDAPNQCVCYIVTRDGHGAAQAGIPLTFTLQGAPFSDSYATAAMIATSDAAGLASINLRQGASYEGKRGKDANPVRFNVPYEDSFQLPQVLGEP